MRAAPSLFALALLIGPRALSAQTSSASLQHDLERLSKGELVAGVPPADSVPAGARSIPAGSTVKGAVVARGPVDVFGTVNGSVVSLTGDVTVHRGGTVTGDAISVGGRVKADSGVVEGEMRTLGSLPTLRGAAAAVDVRSPARQTLDAVRVVAACFAMLLIVAIGVVLFAGDNLDEVVHTIEIRFASAFWYGVVGQLLVLPALVIIVIGLVLSLIGILLVPFVVVAYTIAVAGLVTLGFLATSRLVGGALYRDPAAPARVHALIALGIGVALFFFLWLVAALVTWAPLAAMVVRAAALATTWVAMTLGLGAALVSRAGTHRKVAASARPAELASWLTPTPVTGVVAARRVGGTREGR
ncbi:MAG TPA: polymer-forming cytoskeletal protein [Gemmatimonadaceae bacterium]